MDIAHIREFVALAEMLNFHRAADACFTTQSTLSRHVGAMEEEIGHRLFERTSRSVELTPAGKVAYESFKPIIARYEHAIEVMARLDEGNLGYLAVSCPFYWTGKYVSPVVNRLEQTVPHCTAHVVSCQALEGMANVRSGKTDLCVFPAEPMGDSIASRSFAVESAGIAMLDDDPLADRDSLSIDELDLSVVIMTDRHKYSTSQTLIVDQLSKRGIVPDKLVDADYIDTVGPALRKNGGYAIVPLGTSVMNRPYVRTVRLSEPEFGFTMAVFWRKDNPNPMIREYLTCLAELFPLARLKT